MGIKDLKEAFNRAAEGMGACDRALMSYSREHDVEWQVLVFTGTKKDGTKFSVTRKCKPHSHLETEAAAAAADAFKEAKQ